MRGIKSVKVVEVIRTETVVGTATESDPVRTVIQYWDFDGNLLSENDPNEDNTIL